MKKDQKDQADVQPFIIATRPVSQHLSDIMAWRDFLHNRDCGGMMKGCKYAKNLMCRRIVHNITLEDFKLSSGRSG